MMTKQLKIRNAKKDPVDMESSALIKQTMTYANSSTLSNKLNSQKAFN